MEAALKRELGIAAELINLVPGDHGIFEVRADGDVIFSEKECGGRFPTREEIVKILRARS